MLRRRLTLSKLALVMLLLPAFAGAEELSYYLPGGVEYDPSIPEPAKILGYEVGEWHVRPEQSLEYARTLAEASDRAVLEIQSYTHERRPQPLLIIASPANHARLDEIREQRRRLFDPREGRLSDDDLAEMPAVVFLGYSVHGNEASGANAALIVAYHLVAGQGEVERWLDDVVILLDPSLNPDGLARFASWVNMHRGQVLVGDRQNREHNEAWPGGRTNHYWFDLNRDWLLLQHPESRGRVATLHRWKPNLLGDFHEMGTDSTFFFQPGVPERKNPLIPDGNVDLTGRLARYHADLLDAERRLYYTRESFDDYYPGKASTYPDLQGAVGVLFEQASARGHLAETENGPLPFAFGIKNQFLSSLSMVRGLFENRQDFLRYQRDFFVDALQDARGDARAGFVFATAGDPVRSQRMVELLLGHDIEVRQLARDLEVDGERFAAERSFFVPLEQPQHRLVRSLFEPMTEYEVTTFYDVSTWNLPMAFDAEWAPVSRRLLDGGPGEAISEIAPAPGEIVGNADTAYAFLFEWAPYWAPRALYRLQRAGVQTRVAAEELTVRSGDEDRALAPGAVVVPVGLAGNRDLDLPALMREVAQEDGLRVYAAETGLSAGGLDLGSPQMVAVSEPRPLIVGGRGVSGYEAGEAWHLLDHRFHMAVSIAEMEELGRLDLSRYTHLVLPNGAYGRIPDETRDGIAAWVRGGGTVVGIKGGAVWAATALLGRETEAETPTEEPDPDPERRLYGRYREERAAQLLSGTIVEVELDLTHPLAFGYADPFLPVFRTSTDLLPPGDNPYENVAFYRDEPRLSGYISQENSGRLAGEVALTVSKLGSGNVVQLLDNPNFRAYFYGSNKLFLNSLFLSELIESTAPPASWY